MKNKSVQIKSALYVHASGNTKTGKVDTTYVSIKGSCPNDCTLKNDGCYAQNSFVAFTVKRLDSEFKKENPKDIAEYEARAIDESYNGESVPGSLLRLHVSGDTRTRGAARVLASAVDRWLARGGLGAWSYTHAWRKVKRADFGKISVLASIENSSQAEAVREQGYAPALIVDKFESDKAFERDGFKFIPCPAQTRDVSCADCKLCLKSDFLFESKSGIAFEVHGVKKNSIKKKLNVIQ